MKDIVASAYLRNSDRPVIGADGLGRIGFVNPAAGKLFQVEPDDLIGCSFDNWVVDGDDLLRVALKTDAKETGRRAVLPEPTIRQGQRADGTRVTLAIRAIPLSDEASLSVILELEVRDGSLTDAVEDKRLSEIIKRTPNPVGIADSEGTILYLNPGFWTFLGFDPHEPPASPQIADFHR